MKRFLATFTILAFVVLVGGTFYYLWAKAHAPPQRFETEAPQVIDIVRKTVATGAIVPREEVEIKPRVSGVLELLRVQPGQSVKRGDVIARIRIIPNAEALTRAEAEVHAKKIALDNAARELERNQAAFGRGILPEAELQKAKNEHALADQGYADAQKQLETVREGQVRGAAGQSNVVVTSTVTGMVIDVPVKLGFSVIETNNFNAGTTIAVVADMSDMIFDGQVDEADVGKIAEGQPLHIKIGALETPVEGKLEYIAPKGKTVDGAIQFEIKAAIVGKPDVFIRAGYSANADIVLDHRTQVLSIREALVQFDGGKPYVEVAAGAPQSFVRRPVKLGLSDGINVEVLDGVAKDDRIKLPANAGPAALPAKKT
jgi:HlyD family secretion protein